MARYDDEFDDTGWRERRVQGLVWAAAAALVVIGVALIWWAVDSAEAAETTVINAGDTWEALAPAIAAIAQAVLVPLILAGIGWLYSRVAHKKIEDSHRDAFQTALRNAAGFLVMSAGGKLKGVNFDVRNPALAAAIKMVQNAAPDALDYFGLTPDKVFNSKHGGPKEAGRAQVEKIIADKIIAKIPQLPGGVTDAPMANVDGEVLGPSRLLP